MSSAIVGNLSKQYSGFTPTSIPGCALWLDAADSSTITLSGSNVSQWNDKSGNARNATQTTAGNRPTRVTNGIQFTSANSNYFNILVPWSENVSVFIVATSSSSSQCYFFGRDVNGGGPTFIQNYIGSSLEYYDSTNRSTLSATPSSPFLANFTRASAGGALAIFYNGSNTGNLTSATSGTGNWIIVGATNFGAGSTTITGFINATIYELIFYFQTLPTSQRQQVEGYLARKWGLVSNLPATHPFKTTPLYTRIFQPTDIDGCALWLDAADSSTISLSSGTNGTATLNQFVTTVNQTVTINGTLAGLSSFTGGTTVMGGVYITNGLQGSFAPSASSDIWYAYANDGIYNKVVKLQFTYTGGVLSVKGVNAGYSTNLSGVLSTNSGATNDSNYAGYTSMTFVTNNTDLGYGVASFTMNFLASTLVTQWRDKSGNGRNASVVGSINISSAALGKPAMLYPGSTNTYFTGSITNTGATLTTFAVFSMGSASSGYVRVLSLGAAGQVDYNNIPYVSPLLRLTGTSLGSYRNSSALGSVTFPYSTPVQAATLFDGSTQSVYLNGTAGTTAASSGNFNYSVYEIGSSLNEESTINYTGSIGEVISYNAFLTTSQRQQIEGYLANKWGLRSSLPSTHPFKLYPTLTTIFNPLQVSGCSLWLDAIDSSTVILSSSKVSQWSDKSGNSYHATQSTSANQPSYSNSKIVFSSANQNWMSLNQTFGNLFLNNTAFNVFIVAFGSGSGFITGQTQNTYQNLFLGYGFMDNYNSPWYLQGTPAVADSINSINGFEYTGTGASLYQNGTSFASKTGALSLTAFSGPQIGRRYSGLTYPAGSAVYHDHTFCEIIAFFRVLSTTQRQQVEGYLAWKWGLQGSLPATHPFKKFSP